MISVFGVKCYSDGEFFEELFGENVVCKLFYICYGLEVKGRFCVRFFGERYFKWKWFFYCFK